MSLPFVSHEELEAYIERVTATDPETGDRDVIGSFCFVAIKDEWYYLAECDPATPAIKTIMRHTSDPLLGPQGSGVFPSPFFDDRVTANASDVIPPEFKNMIH